MRGSCLTIIFLIGLLFGFKTSYANPCDDLQALAIKCLERKLSWDELDEIGGCESPDARFRLVEMILENDIFIGRLILIMRLELLQGTTIDGLFEAIQDFDLILFTQPANFDWATMESRRLYKVYHLATNYMEHIITFEEVYTSYFNNWIYDQQNMGLDNFINSTFVYALGRYPTKAEYNNAINMLSDEEGVLFYERGSSKDDYLRILTNNYNFMEKQVKYWHYYFTYDYPDKDEVYEILADIKQAEESVSILGIIRYMIYHKA